jgi:hypothetical protein
LTEDEWRRLPDLALDHGLSTLINGVLADTGAPDEVRQAVRDHAMGSLAVQLQVEADLRVVSAVLDSTGVAWTTVKGPALSEHWYARSGQRTYVDLDVVVDPAGFDRALDALLDAGAVLVDRNFTHALQQRRAELNLVLPHGTVLDLHWHVLNTPQLRAQFPLSMDQWLSRRIPIRIGGLEVPTFDADDTLLHLCLHTVLSGGRKLSWFRDLHEVVAAGQVDWQVFFKRTEAAHAGLLVAVALERTRRLCNAVVPEAYEDRLAVGGRAWRRGLRVLEAVSPPGGAMDRRFSGQLVWKSTRGNTGDSLRALGQTFAKDLVHPLLHEPEHPWRRLGRRTPERKDNPLRRPADDTGDRARYLEYVVSQARGDGHHLE